MAVFGHVRYFFQRKTKQTKTKQTKRNKTETKTKGNERSREKKKTINFLSQLELKNKIKTNKNK